MTFTLIFLSFFFLGIVWWHGYLTGRDSQRRRNARIFLRDAARDREAAILRGRAFARKR